MPEPIGTNIAGEFIANLRTRFGDLTDAKYPALLFLRDATNSIRELVSEGQLDQTDYVFPPLTIPSTDNVINLSIFDDYKLLTEITSIAHDTGLCKNIDEAEFIVQGGYGSSSVYRDEIIWYRKGYVLYFYKGTGVSSYGQRTIFANRLPYAAAMDEALDLKDDKISLLEDKILIKAGLKLPQQNKTSALKTTEKEKKEK